MCGISVIVTRNPGGEYQDYIRDMTGLVRHRGPDNLACEALLGGVVHVGHTRLSIIDISHEADQPMCLERGGLWILYNGEVYNYIELRAELERLGHTFRTGSDTEVVLVAYKEWGADCLKRFNGMFAFTIIDIPDKRLFAARDRLGVKPLYYHHVPGRLLCLASEIKQFTALPSFRPRINPQRVFDYLAQGMLDHTRETMFSSVLQLRGGQCMEVSLEPGDQAFAQPRIQTWWSLPVHPKDEDITMEEASLKFQDLLEDSVRLRLRSDVPVGSCLSGGLDSSSIVCLVNRILGAGKSLEIQKTFSSCFNDGRYDERTYIEEVIAQAGIESHYTFPDPETLFRVMDAITWHQDEPFGSMSIFAQWQVFNLARAHGVKVMLDGQGADELLGGYHGFLWAWMAGMLRRGETGSMLGAFRAIRDRHGYHLRDALINLCYIFSPGRIRAAGRSLMGRPDTPEWIQPRIIREYGLDPCAAVFQPASSVRDLSREQLLNTNLPALLHYEDRNSMAHSIEARIPFLDYRLVEFAYSLPDEFKIRDGQTKEVLREAIRDIVPERIRRRQDKMGFVTPEEQWMRHTHNADFQAILRENIGFLDPWIDRSKLEDRFRSITQGSRAFDWSIWRIINAGIWARQFHMDFRVAS